VIKSRVLYEVVSDLILGSYGDIRPVAVFQGFLDFTGILRISQSFGVGLQNPC
jgi:hypothetical protein